MATPSASTILNLNTRNKCAKRAEQTKPAAKSEILQRVRAWERLLHVALVGLDHFLDHLAADGAGFAGGQVAVVAVLEVDADFPRRSFTY